MINTLFNSIKKVISVRQKEESSPFYCNHTTDLDKQIIENSIAISQKYQYIYTRIYKSANSTVVSSLYYAETGIEISNTEKLKKIKKNYFTKPSQLTLAEVNQLNEYFKFTFIRNPTKRFLSCYLDKISRRNSSQRKLVESALQSQPDSEITIDQFIHYLESGGLRTNGHWAPQTDFLTMPIKNYNFIGKTENIDSELRIILRKLFGQSTVITVNNHSTREQAKHINLDNAIKNRLKSLYKSDYDLYNSI